MKMEIKNAKSKINSLDLTYCDLGIAYECNMKCLMCRFWLDSPLNKDNVLSIDEWIEVLKQLAGCIDKQNCVINFSGPGEPLLREGIFRLIRTGRDLGLNIKIISNGLCVSENMAKKINESGLEHICFSLDSLNEHKHDMLRGKEQALSHVLMAIEDIRAFSPKTMIGINTVISNVNMEGLIELVEWVQANRNIAYINFQAIAQPFSYYEASDEQWFKQDKYRQLWPQDSRLTEKTIDQLIELKTKGYKIADDVNQLKVFARYFHDPVSFIKNRCNLKQANVLNIDPAGNTAICQLAGIIGNVRNNTLDEIFRSEEAAGHIKKISQCQRNCHLVVSCYFEDED